ncbi:SAV_6107 family HEPN domain-containing protein [Frankia sp. Cpl3]|nr:SAV_6107 family HEPN domain-containing protein [Parafrankia colletiae]MCK9900459.1 SAV_6107 family HEPN domain-containing protein [Frankia sp. Cpl3]
MGAVRKSVVEGNVVERNAAVGGQHEDRGVSGHGTVAGRRDGAGRPRPAGPTQAPRPSTPAARGQVPDRPAGRTMLPAAGLPRRSRDELLSSARRGLAEAALTRPAGERYALAHLAALRAAAAVLADRAQPRPGHRGRPASAWQLLAVVAPELQEWAAFFAAGAGRRAAAEAGLPVVTTRDADDLVREVELFLGIVEAALGVPSQPSLSQAAPTEVWTWR